jgi:hypothetical protein
MAEAARFLDVPTSTFASWARGYRKPRARGADIVGEPIVTSFRATNSGPAPVVPFVGLAEGLVLAAIRHQGVPLQRIRPALAVLARELGIDHALASRALYTDGAEVLYDYAEAGGDTPEARSARDLVVVRNKQRVFTEVVDDYLHRIEYGPDSYAARLRLPGYERATVLVDPARSFGRPILRHGGARVADVLQRFWADPDEDLDSLSAEFGVPVTELLDLLRVASRRAA